MQGGFGSGDRKEATASTPSMDEDNSSSSRNFGEGVAGPFGVRTVGEGSFGFRNPTFQAPPFFFPADEQTQGRPGGSFGASSGTGGFGAPGLFSGFTGRAQAATASNDQTEGGPNPFGASSGAGTLASAPFGGGTSSTANMPTSSDASNRLSGGGVPNASSVPSSFGSPAAFTPSTQTPTAPRLPIGGHAPRGPNEGGTSLFGGGASGGLGRAARSVSTPLSIWQSKTENWSQPRFSDIAKQTNGMSLFPGGTGAFGAPAGSAGFNLPAKPEAFKLSTSGTSGTSIAGAEERQQPLRGAFEEAPAAAPSTGSREGSRPKFSNSSIMPIGLVPIRSPSSAADGPTLAKPFGPVRTAGVTTKDSPASTDPHSDDARAAKRSDGKVVDMMASDEEDDEREKLGDDLTGEEEEEGNMNNQNDEDKEDDDEDDKEGDEEDEDGMSEGGGSSRGEVGSSIASPREEGEEEVENSDDKGSDDSQEAGTGADDTEESSDEDSLRWAQEAEKDDDDKMDAPGSDVEEEENQEDHILATQRPTAAYVKKKKQQTSRVPTPDEAESQRPVRDEKRSEPQDSQTSPVVPGVQTFPRPSTSALPRFGMSQPSDLDLLANAADSANQSKAKGVQSKAKGVARAKGGDVQDLFFDSSSSSSSGEEEEIVAGESEVEGEANDIDMTGSNKPGAAETTVQEEEDDVFPHRSAGYFASKPGRQFPESRPFRDMGALGGHETDEEIANTGASGEDKMESEDEDESEDEGGKGQGLKRQTMRVVGRGRRTSAHAEQDEDMTDSDDEAEIRMPQESAGRRSPGIKRPSRWGNMPDRTSARDEVSVEEARAESMRQEDEGMLPPAAGSAGTQSYRGSPYAEHRRRDKRGRSAERYQQEYLRREEQHLREMARNQQYERGPLTSSSPPRSLSVERTPSRSASPPAHHGRPSEYEWGREGGSGEDYDGYGELESRDRFFQRLALLHRSRSPSPRRGSAYNRHGDVSPSGRDRHRDRSRSRSRRRNRDGRSPTNGRSSSRSPRRHDNRRHRATPFEEERHKYRGGRSGWSVSPTRSTRQRSSSREREARRYEREARLEREAERSEREARRAGKWEARRSHEQSRSNESASDGGRRRSQSPRRSPSPTAVQMGDRSTSHGYEEASAEGNRPAMSAGYGGGSGYPIPGPAMFLLGGRYLFSPFGMYPTAMAGPPLANEEAEEESDHDMAAQSNFPPRRQEEDSSSPERLVPHDDDYLSWGEDGDGPSEEVHAEVVEGGVQVGPRDKRKHSSTTGPGAADVRVRQAAVDAVLQALSVRGGGFRSSEAGGGSGKRKAGLNESGEGGDETGMLGEDTEEADAMDSGAVDDDGEEEEEVEVEEEEGEGEEEEEGMESDEDASRYEGRSGKRFRKEDTSPDEEEEEIEEEEEEEEDMEEEGGHPRIPPAPAPAASSGGGGGWGDLPGMAKLMSGDKWRCNACYASNEASSAKCLSCDSPRSDGASSDNRDEEEEAEKVRQDDWEYDQRCVCEFLVDQVLRHTLQSPNAKPEDFAYELIEQVDVGGVFARAAYMPVLGQLLKCWVEQLRLCQDANPEADGQALAKTLVLLNYDFTRAGAYTDTLEHIKTLVPQMPPQFVPSFTETPVAVPAAWDGGDVPEAALSRALVWIQRRVGQRVDELLRPFHTVLQAIAALEQTQLNDKRMADQHLQQALEAVTQARTELPALEQEWQQISQQALMHHAAMKDVLLAGYEFLPLVEREVFLVGQIMSEWHEPRRLSSTDINKANQLHAQAREKTAALAARQSQLQLQEAIHALVTLVAAELKSRTKAAVKTQKGLVKDTLNAVRDPIKALVQALGTHTRALLDAETRVQEQARDSMVACKAMHDTIGLLPTRVAARNAWSAAHDILDRSAQRVSSLVECVATLWDQKLVLPLPSQARDSLKGLFESAAQTQVTTLKARVAMDQGRLVDLGDDAMLQGNAA